MKNAPPAPPLPHGWPVDKPLAVSVSVMVEGWTDDTAPGIGPMGNPLKAGVFDTQARSWAEYGPKTGAWHLLEALHSAGAKAVFYISGILVERHPDLVRAIASEGHAIAAHAWAQNIVPACQSIEEESADLSRCIAAIEKCSGTRPRGWISPRATPSQNTPRLLAEEKFNWYADSFDRDLPYLVETPKANIVAIPFTMDVNDFPLSIRYGNTPNTYNRILAGILEGWSDLGNPAGCLDLTVHAHVFGRPAGVIAFKAALRQAALCRSVWVTHHAAIADLYAGESDPIRP